MEVIYRPSIKKNGLYLFHDIFRTQSDLFGEEHVQRASHVNPQEKTLLQDEKKGSHATFSHNKAEARFSLIMHS
jgi:hypothetical protein